MKKLICCAFALAAASAAFTAETKTVKPIDPAEQKARDARLMQFVARPGSQKGTVAFVNAAGLDPRILDGVVSNLYREVALNFKVVKGGKVDAATATSEMKKLSVNVAVFVIAEKGYPAELVSLEDNWAIVNYEAIRADGTAGAALDKRMAFAAHRAFLAAAGSYTSQFPGNVMASSDWQKLDRLQMAFIPVDVNGRMLQYLSSIGVTPVKMVRYRTACEEGWAPKPVNLPQQQIWDKVHAMPSNPIKIKYDPKRDK